MSDTFSSSTPILDSAIRAVQRDLAAVPDGKKGALVAIVRSKHDWEFGVAGKVGDNWQLSAALEKRATEDPSVRLAVVRTW